MSEQNILNPTVLSDLSPDFPIKQIPPATIARSQARSGRPSAKRFKAAGKVFQLQWTDRLFSTKDALMQWFNQYEQDFFTLWDANKGRYYSGQFDDSPTFEDAGNNRVNITANFVEIPGLAMFQYPSAWGVDSVFRDERDGFGSDQVKLTGTWFRYDQNYLLWSEQFDNAAWVKGANVTVVANNQTDPNGGNTADTVSTGATAAQGVTQTTGVAARNGFQFTVSVQVKAAVNTNFTITIDRGAGTDAETSPAKTATTAWQTFSFTHSAVWTGTTAIRVTITITNSASSIIPWGAQFEYGAAATTYAQTLGTTSPLVAPNSNPSLHNGYAYWDAGTVTTDVAEWLYLGYGIRVWSYKGPDMGIMQVLLDGVSQGTVDLYAAAATASAAVFTLQNVSLGTHRVGLAPTNTKNAASSGFIVAADAIEVMR